MSLTLYDFGGLRFWREQEIKARDRICDQIANEIMTSLKEVNQGWAFERVDTPLIIPRSALNAEYGTERAFWLADRMGGSEMVLRAETTAGSYLVAQHLLKNTRVKPPLGIWQLGQSFRRELSDGASASNLRFNAFYQLEFQLIYAEDTHFDYAALLEERLTALVAKITNLPARIVVSDRLPSYSERTRDIEVEWHPPTKDRSEWKEVASMSLRTDFPQSHFKKPVRVLEIAFGADRMVAVTQGEP